LYLVHIFRHSPLTALAVCLCMGTILWCVFLTRRHRSRLDRFLSAALGFITIYQALRTLKDTGVAVLPGFRQWDAFVDVMISAMCLIAAAILKLSYLDRTSTSVRLRLSEANEKTMDVSRGAQVIPHDVANSAIEASPLAMVAVDVNGMVSYWNASAERLFGWKRDEMLGHRPPFPVELNGDAASNTRFRTKYGEPIEAAAWSAQMKHPTGSLRGTLMVVADSSTLLEAGLGVNLATAK